MKEIRVGKKFVALVDDEDFERLAKLKWCHSKGKNTYYAVTDILHPDDPRYRRCISMQRLVMGDPEGFLVDHKDGNGMNCQKRNLRVVSNAQNSMNSGPRNGKKYKGTSFDKAKQKWRAQIIVGGKRPPWSGYFETEEAAARAYDRLAIQNFGEFAWLNFPNEVIRDGMVGN